MVSMVRVRKRGSFENVTVNIRGCAGCAHARNVKVTQDIRWFKIAPRTAHRVQQGYVE
jgi:predicted alpha/beta-fold hydrolase